MKENEIKYLTKEEITKTKRMCKNIRRAILEMVYSAQSGHIGGSLSCVDILTVLYHHVMNLKINKKTGLRTDKFVMSKGHASPAYYAVLSSKGFIDPEELKTFRNINSFLEGHPTNKIPGVDTGSGSLGQGLSIANGFAMANKIDKIEDSWVYCLLGDGELEEGQVWEAAMTAGHYVLNNVIAVVDYNCLQIDGKLSEVKSPEPIKDKFIAFKWDVIEIDGHDVDAICQAFTAAKLSDKPTCIIAYTTKGKGISFMENKAEWHGKAPNEKEFKLAKGELK
ncbi:MAG: transketolase [Clostridia bacterium]